MNPIDLIPSPDSIPVHWGWFKLFLTVTFFLHLLLMNAMVGTAFISFACRRSPLKDRIGALVSKNLTLIIPFTINFGVAPLLFLQLLYGNFMYVSSQLIAVYWLFAVLLMMIVYYAAYYSKFNFPKLKEKSKLYLSGTIVILFLMIAFIFSNNMTLMLNPSVWIRYFDNPHGTLLNLADPSLIPRFLHFMIASAAVGGLFIALLGLNPMKKASADIPVVHYGMKWFTYATLVQTVAGFWFLMSLPREVMLLFMGGSAVHTAILMISLVLTGVVVLSGISNRVKTSLASALGLIFLMVVMRDFVRTAYLQPYFDLSRLEVTGQYSPLVIFLAALAFGLAGVVYVLGISMRTKEG